MLLYTTQHPLLVGPHFDITLRPIFLLGFNWSRDGMGRHFAIHFGPLTLMWWRLAT